MKPEDIAIAHRLPSRGEKLKGIIVRFATRDARDRAIRNRRVLKDSGVVVVEDLCYGIQTHLKYVSKHIKVSTAWSWHGKVFAKLKGNDAKIIPVEYGQRVDDLMARH